MLFLFNKYNDNDKELQQGGRKNRISQLDRNPTAATSRSSFPTQSAGKRIQQQQHQQQQHQQQQHQQQQGALRENLAQRRHRFLFCFWFIFLIFSFLLSFAFLRNGLRKRELLEVKITRKSYAPKVNNDVLKLIKITQNITQELKQKTFQPISLTA